MQTPSSTTRLATLTLCTLLGTTMPQARAASAPDPSPALDQASAAGLYRVALLPPIPLPPVNQMHNWRVRLTTPDGAPVHGAQIDVDGGMPQHGHGLPTRPRVTRELGTDGTYLLEGMKFSMTGRWEIRMAIQAAPGADRIRFETLVPTPKVRP